MKMVVSTRCWSFGLVEAISVEPRRKLVKRTHADELVTKKCASIDNDIVLRVLGWQRQPFNKCCAGLSAKDSRLSDKFKKQVSGNPDRNKVSLRLARGGTLFCLQYASIGAIVVRALAPS